MSLAEFSNTSTSISFVRVASRGRLTPLAVASCGHWAEGDHSRHGFSRQIVKFSTVANATRGYRGGDEDEPATLFFIHPHAK